MLVGLPKEIKIEEYRAGLTSFAVQEFVARGPVIVSDHGIIVLSSFNSLWYGRLQNDPAYYNIDSEAVNELRRLEDLCHRYWRGRTKEREHERRGASPALRVGQALANILNPNRQTA